MVDILINIVYLLIASIVFLTIITFTLIIYIIKCK